MRIHLKRFRMFAKPTAFVYTTNPYKTYACAENYFTRGNDSKLSI